MYKKEANKMYKRRLLLILGLLLTLFATMPILAEESSRIERTTASGMSIMLQKNQSEAAQIVYPPAAALNRPLKTASPKL
jgi:hypothetical protein